MLPLFFFILLPWFFCLLGSAVLSFLALGIKMIWLDLGCLERFVYSFLYCRAHSEYIAANLSKFSRVVCNRVPEEVRNIMLRPGDFALHQGEV